ncbi:GDSL-type esterase/lipase family protein [Kordiimonas aquimaris]|uniref:GDSL-type esterase/lipase family protein n=1 Tax=Kordiimonas aquimaris TaxID=707591 RepID=UPI0021D37B74|nr:GDSL-type esterase/lipase family protein [Kordiimonas aquimaris]
MTIGFFGDGFVAGEGDPEGAGWVGQLAEATQFSFANFGAEGATSADVLKRWNSEAQHHSFSGLVFSFGAEDCLFGAHKRPQVGQLERLKNTKALMMAARAHAPTVFVSPFPVVGREQAAPCIANTARQMTTIARANKVFYVNIYEAVADNAVWQKEAGERDDGKYPRAAGYQAATDLIVQDDMWRTWLAKITT